MKFACNGDALSPHQSWCDNKSFFSRRAWTFVSIHVASPFLVLELYSLVPFTAVNMLWLVTRPSRLIASGTYFAATNHVRDAPRWTSFDNACLKKSLYLYIISSFPSAFSKTLCYRGWALYVTTSPPDSQPTAKMGPKSFLRVYLSVIILCINYMIFTCALPGVGVSPDIYVRMNTSLLSVGSLEAVTKDYVVWPKEPGNVMMASDIDRTMATIVSRRSITPYTSPRTGIEFWVVTATDLEAQHLLHIPNVSVLW